jgi:ribosomal protein L23
MYRRETLIKNIILYLSYLELNVQNTGIIHLFDDNIISENFFRDFLKLVYGYELKNLNMEDKNKKGIDLGSKNDNKLSIQITSDGSKKKVQDTIDKVTRVKDEDGNITLITPEYERLKVVVIGRKNDYRKDTVFETYGKLIFNRDEDILDIKDIIAQINDKETKDMEDIFKFLSYEIYFSDDMKPLIQRSIDFDKKIGKKAINLKAISKTNNWENSPDEIKSNVVYFDEIHQTLTMLPFQTREILALIYKRAKNGWITFEQIRLSIEPQPSKHDFQSHIIELENNKFISTDSEDPNDNQVYTIYIENSTVGIETGWKIISKEILPFLESRTIPVEIFFRDLDFSVLDE